MKLANFTMSISNYVLESETQIPQPNCSVRWSLIHTSIYDKHLYCLNPISPFSSSSFFSVLILDAWRSSFHFPNPESECWSKKIFWKRIRQNYNGQMCIKPNPVRRTDLPVLPANTRIDSLNVLKYRGPKNRFTEEICLLDPGWNIWNWSCDDFRFSLELPYELIHMTWVI